MPSRSSAQDALDGEFKERDLRAAIVNELEYTYGPWLVILGFSVFLSLDPATEILVGLLFEIQENTYWVLFNRDPTNWVHQLSVVGLALLPIVAHACGAATMRLCGKLDEKVIILDILIFVLCLIGYGIAFYIALWSPEAEELQINKTISIIFLSIQLTVWSVIYWIFIISRRYNVMNNFITIVLPVFTAGLVCISAYIGMFSPSSAIQLSPVAVTTGFAISACLLISALTVLSSNLPIRLPLILVVLALSFASKSLLVALALAVVFAVLAVVQYQTRIRWNRLGSGIYGCAALLCVAYAAGAFFVTDCKSLSGCNIIDGTKPNHAGFETVAETVPHIATDPDKPLRIVAAQGGGLYAAYHTAYYLATRTDLDPEFSASLYAISGVSGGSVGAGVYWAVVTSGLCTAPGDGSSCHRDAVDQILNRDYLSPSLAAFLFRDHLDTYLPISAVATAMGRGPIDRGHVLEQEIDAAVANWRQSMGADGDTGLKLPIGDAALRGRTKHDTTQKFPYLFLNGTQVDTGFRALISPVRRLRHSWANMPLKDEKHLSTLNGMVVSARFPLVTPPARVIIDGFDRYETVQLVDGGYFDNSGIETALDIVLELQEAGVQRPIHLLTFDADKEFPEPEIQGLLGAPISAFTGAWRARREHSSVRIDDVLEARSPPIDYEVCKVTADVSNLNFTVSWYLSAATFKDLATQTTRTARNHHSVREAC